MREGQFIGDGRFELIDQLGAGGMATVWRARDSRLKVLRAIKILSPAMAQHRRAAQRFLAEAQAMAGIEHPNVARIYDFNVDPESGATYLVMELITGQDLKNHIVHHGPQTPQAATEMMIPILRGLAHVHQEGIVHRDIKPSNILIGADHIPKLVDFGIARITDSTMDATKTGAIMGTFNYMAPEQHISTKSAGPQADIYSCGGTFFYMLTGYDPINLAVDSYQSELFEPLPEPLIPILHEACSPRPETRFQSANDFIQALESVQSELAGLSAQPRPNPAPQRANAPLEDEEPDESDTWGGFGGTEPSTSEDEDWTRDFMAAPPTTEPTSDSVSQTAPIPPKPKTAAKTKKPSNQIPLLLLGVGLVSIALALVLEKGPDTTSSPESTKTQVAQDPSPANAEMEQTPTQPASTPQPVPVPPAQKSENQVTESNPEPAPTPEADDYAATAMSDPEGDAPGQTQTTPTPAPSEANASEPTKATLLGESEIDAQLATIIQTYNELVRTERTLRSESCEQKGELLRQQIDHRRQIASLQRTVGQAQPQEVHLTARIIFGMALIQTSELSAHLTTTCPDQAFTGLADLAAQAQTGQSLLDSALAGSEQLGLISRWTMAGAKLR